MGVAKFEVAGSVGGAVESDEATAFEGAVNDSGGEVEIMEHSAPGFQGVLRGEDHRAFSKVSIVDDVKVKTLMHYAELGIIGAR